jgi:hypothetical protein
VGGSSIFPPTEDVPHGAGRTVAGYEAWWVVVVVTFPLNHLFFFTGMARIARRGTPCLAGAPPLAPCQACAARGRGGLRLRARRRI